MTYRERLAAVPAGTQAIQMFGGYLVLLYGVYLEWGFPMMAVVGGLWCCVDVWIDHLSTNGEC